MCERAAESGADAGIAQGGFGNDVEVDPGRRGNDIMGGGESDPESGFGSSGSAGKAAVADIGDGIGLDEEDANEELQAHVLKPCKQKWANGGCTAEPRCHCCHVCRHNALGASVRYSSRAGRRATGRQSSRCYNCERLKRRIAELEGSVELVRAAS